MEMIAQILFYAFIVALIVSIYFTIKYFRKNKKRFINRTMNNEVENFMLEKIKENHVINPKEIRNDTWKFIKYKYPECKLNKSFVSNRERALRTFKRIEKNKNLQYGKRSLHDT